MALVRKHRWLPLLGALLAAGLLLAACGGGGETPNDNGGASTGNEITVRGEDFAYSPSPVELQVNEEYTFTFVNDGAQFHDLHIEGLRVQVDGQETTELTLEAEPGESASVTLTPLEAGTVEFWCTVPGHRDLGMLGELVVNE